MVKEYRYKGITKPFKYITTISSEGNKRGGCVGICVKFSSKACPAYLQNYQP